uniref:N-terminal methionine N(alpha)-acetyltransferase NatC n=1 Tax=Anopheles atroparvus TaxID=41427 RepID=A0AAG5CW58_ANOAO
MDVIGRDVLPTDTKASATKLTNGNATLSEDNAATVAAGAGRKKSKRKSKAKNSHREDAESELKIEAPSTRATTTATAEKLSAASVTLPKVATSMVETKSGERANGESVNSNSNRAFGSSSIAGSSSSHRSSHSNGLPADDALVESSVDAISKKLEQCVQISRNGLTNGLPKQEEVGSGTVDGTITTTTSGKEPSTGKASKKKHRSSQAKKAQPTKTNCTVNGSCEHGDDEVEVQEQVGVDPFRKRQTSNALPGPDSMENKQFIGSQSGSDNMKILDVDKTVNPTETCSCPGNDPDGGRPSTAPSAPTSPVSLPTSAPNDVGSEETREDSAENRRAPVQITYQVYESERQMPAIMSLIQKDLSEPYSIYTYRYFIHNWPKLCFLALHEDACVGAIVCKLDIHRQDTRRGYIAMLAVDKDYRKLKIGTTLVQKAIQVMVEDNADEVVLETEITNQPALRLYENLGFVRDKRLFHYYLNGVDALRLKLWFR